MNAANLPPTLAARLAAHPLHHVAIAVWSIEEARAIYTRISGEAGTPLETVASQGVRVAFFGSVELLEPYGEDSGIRRFLDRRGPGLHHLAWEVPDLASELQRLAEAGFELLDPEPRIGAGGHRVAFLHPRSCGGVLVELVEHTG
jgi:methylmalonyl-CoA/ethylmalonyl-CoA epimerase